MTLKLYQIANEFQSLMATLDDDNDPITLQKLEDIKLEADTKIKNVAMMIKTLQYERDIVDGEIKRLAKKQKSYDDQVEWLRGYLVGEMQRLDIAKVCNKPYFNVSLREGRLKLDPLEFDADLIPDEYKEVKQVVSIDKKRIVDELAMGVIVPGAALTQESYVEIR